LSWLFQLVTRRAELRVCREPHLPFAPRDGPLTGETRCATPTGPANPRSAQAAPPVGASGRKATRSATSRSPARQRSPPRSRKCGGSPVQAVRSPYPQGNGGATGDRRGEGADGRALPAAGLTHLVVANYCRHGRLRLVQTAIASKRNSAAPGAAGPASSVAPRARGG
jgi:hypothetical protein